MNKNIIKKSKFITGESRYCQNCGIESHELFAVNQENKKIDKLKYCIECENKIKIKSGVNIN